MRRLISLSLIAASAAFAGCGTTTTTNNGMTNLGTNKPNSNIVVVNNNGNANTGAMNTNSGNSNRWNANITEEEYNKDKTGYSTGKRATETVGSGAKDSWLWFKTRSALATTADLRDSTIDVDVENGVITLKGTVATAAQKASAMKVASGIEGKTGAVKDMLKVSATDSALSTKDGDTKPAASATPKK
jgi:hyperosmotically inducible protein